MAGICIKKRNRSKQGHQAKAQELVRIPKSDIVEATQSSQMAKCYQLFHAEYPDMWNEILMTFADAGSLIDAERTVAHWQQTFVKVIKNMILMFNSMAKAYTIEGAFLIAGKVVNQDGGLRHVFTTEGAWNFFVDHCRADDNEILAHFKAHIYNGNSLDHVTVASDAPAEQVPKNNPKESEKKECKKDAENADEGVEIVDPND